MKFCSDFEKKTLTIFFGQKKLFFNHMCGSERKIPSAKAGIGHYEHFERVSLIQSRRAVSQTYKYECTYRRRTSFVLEILVTCRELLIFLPKFN